MNTLNLSAPKGLQEHSPGQHPGFRWTPGYTPCKGKSILIFTYATNLLPLQGEYTTVEWLPRVLPWAMFLLPLQGVSL